MDQKRLDILNLMARLDKEAPFSTEDAETLPTAEFDSIEDASAAFESTLAMRDSIRVQGSADQIPEAWIERIQNFSDEPDSEQSPSFLSALEGWVTSIRKLVFGQSQSWNGGMTAVLGRTQYWGAGLVTAGVLAIVFAPFGGQVTGPGLGGGIQNPALPGGVSGTTVISASLSTKEIQESGLGSAQDLSELTAEKGIKRLSVPTEESDKSSEDCDTALEVSPAETRESELSGRCLDKQKEESP